MKTRKLRKILSITLAIAMLTALISVAHAEEVEKLIYSEDFNSVSSETKTLWHTAYDRETAVQGQWYLYSGDVYTHNLAFGKAGTASESRIPLPFGTTLDIANNKYEMTFKINHIQSLDTVMLACVATNAGYGLDTADTFRAMGTNTYDIKIVIENQAWTIYRKPVSDSEYTWLASRSNIAGATLDGLIFQVLADSNEYIHAIDDICVKQINKTTGDVIATVYEENFDDWTMESKGTGKSIDEICETDFYTQYKTKYTGFLTQPYLLPLSSGNDDGCLGYLQKSSHRTNGDGVDNFMRFVFPEAMTEGKYKITFDYSPSKKDCSWIYLQSMVNGTLNSVQGTTGTSGINTTWPATGFSTHNLIIDMDNKTCQLDEGTPISFSFGVIDRISFRQHLDAGASRTTLIDNFRIYKYIDASELTADTLSVTSSSFTDGSGNSLAVTPTSGTINADVNLGINVLGNYSFSSIIALYDANETLLGVDFDAVDISSSEASKSVSLSIDAKAQASKCKVFFWYIDGDKFIPLSNSVELPAN